MLGDTIRDPPLTLRIAVIVNPAKLERSKVIQHNDITFMAPCSVLSQTFFHAEEHSLQEVSLALPEGRF